MADGIRCMGFCRGHGVGYAVFSLPLDAKTPSVRALTQNGAELPSAVYPLGPYAVGQSVADRREHRMVVAVVPLLDVSFRVEIVSSSIGGTLASFRYEPLRSKVQSRLFTHRNPALAEAVRGIELREEAGRPTARVLEVWPGGAGELVWRFSVRFPEGDSAAPLLMELIDREGGVLDGEVHVLEDHIVPAEGDAERLERLVTVSVRLSEDITGLCVSFSLCDGKGNLRQSCFTAVSPGMLRGMADQSRWLSTGGAASNGYARWFSAHRATEGLLAWQRAHVPQAQPFISIVVPVFRTPPVFLSACIESVLAQSYPIWELVLVNASPDDADVVGVIERYRDERITVVSAPNRSIADNTNRGIAAATGAYVAFLDHDDVLEPDALWRYAVELNEHPETDLIYCDEDRLRDGELVNPAFKAEPDLTLLRSYNYVTHFLMVSRYVLERTARTEDALSGAQDYDLALKAFEVAHRVAHVPRVLYHWREHAASTASGAEQKPYAHEAGRRALQSHLERTDGGTVTDGPLPCTYRVRLCIPDPAPLVSIVIPNRDHADLLDACVSSILEKTVYPSYEIVVVENGSSNPETFALYRKLAEDERVSVITWSPDELAPGAPQENGFNYAAIVNAGARASRGDYLVFLNNDTDVIEPAWLDEMVACFSRDKVGVVGAKLLFQDGLVQHAGMVANARGDFAHINRNLAADELGYAYSAGLPREYSMVTGACQMTRRGLFEELGGYDEELAVGFNDGDFCLSAREAGYVVVYQPAALLHHREFSTRGREATDSRLQARLLREKAYITAKHPSFFAAPDPAVNPNLDHMSDWWALPETR